MRAQRQALATELGQDQTNAMPQGQGPGYSVEPPSLATATQERPATLDAPPRVHGGVLLPPTATTQGQPVALNAALVAPPSPTTTTQEQPVTLDTTPVAPPSPTTTTQEQATILDAPPSVRDGVLLPPTAPVALDVAPPFPTITIQEPPTTVDAASGFWLSPTPAIQEQAANSSTASVVRTSPAATTQERATALDGPSRIPAEAPASPTGTTHEQPTTTDTPSRLRDEVLPPLSRTGQDQLATLDAAPVVSPSPRTTTQDQPTTLGSISGIPLSPTPATQGQPAPHDTPGAEHEVLPPPAATQDQPATPETPRAEHEVLAPPVAPSQEQAATSEAPGTHDEAAPSPTAPTQGQPVILDTPLSSSQGHATVPAAVVLPLPPSPTQDQPTHDCALGFPASPATATQEQIRICHDIPSQGTPPCDAMEVDDDVSLAPTQSFSVAPSPSGTDLNLNDTQRARNGYWDIEKLAAIRMSDDGTTLEALLHWTQTLITYAEAGDPVWTNGILENTLGLEDVNGGTLVSWYPSWEDLSILTDSEAELLEVQSLLNRTQSLKSTEGQRRTTLETKSEPFERLGKIRTYKDDDWKRFIRKIGEKKLGSQRCRQELRGVHVKWLKTSRKLRKAQRELRDRIRRYNQAMTQEQVAEGADLIEIDSD